MKINYDILKQLLDCNKGMKLIFRDDSNILDLFICNKIYLSLELSDNVIKNHSEEIYNAIINLEHVTMYIPKIYIKEN